MLSSESPHLFRAAAGCLSTPGVFGHCAVYCVEPVLSFNEWTVKSTPIIIFFTIKMRFTNLIIIKNREHVKICIICSGKSTTYLSFKSVFSYYPLFTSCIMWLTLQTKLLWYRFLQSSKHIGHFLRWAYWPVEWAKS